MDAYLLALGIGFVAGLRSMMPLAMLRAAKHDWTGILFAVVALGELIADKLPQTPSRLSIMPLAGRIVVGAYAGATVSAFHSGSLVAGALIGAAAALAGSYAGHAYRTQLASRVPDLTLALVEDAVAIGLGFVFGYRALLVS